MAGEDDMVMVWRKRIVVGVHGSARRTQVAVDRWLKEDRGGGDRRPGGQQG